MPLKTKIGLFNKIVSKYVYDEDERNTIPVTDENNTKDTDVNRRRLNRRA